VIERAGSDDERQPVVEVVEPDVFERLALVGVTDPYRGDGRARAGTSLTSCVEAR
jgi:hypothetical protein